MAKAALAGALTLALGIAAGSAHAGATPNILQGLFSYDDLRQGRDNCSQIQVDGDEHEAGGVVTGIGLNGDTVVLSYTMPFVDTVRVKRQNAIVKQSDLARLDVDITPGAGSPTTVYNGTANPEKGRVIARIIRGGAQSRVQASFELGEGFSGLAPVPDSDQSASILAALADRNDIKFKEKNGRLRILHQGEPTGTCP